ncbi:hypothetical protein L873DRAFT_1799811 [Choiromyces venosus 120613-1]|uniref:Uncharacterized protein n=1 Tax=Choiromyces venosus 120613-1 TaxID=1336337 RepID=A0A3N4K113_9PEZI|nr:hypothetical protein L873DRAFT_1799811 [Choiromyces venosus 120613-1]
MLRLSQQARMFPPTLVHRRIWFRKYSDEFTLDGTGHCDKPNDIASDSVKPKVEPDRGGIQSGLMWDRMNRLDDKIDCAIKNHGDLKVDVTSSINKLGNKLGDSIYDLKSEIHKEFADIKSDQKVSRWQVNFLFIAASSLVLWCLKDYIQLRFLSLPTVEEPTPCKTPEPPQKHKQKK